MNRFRYYYEIAEDLMSKSLYNIIQEAPIDTAAAQTPDPNIAQPPVPEPSPPAGVTPPPTDATAQQPPNVTAPVAPAATPAPSPDGKITGEVKDKVNDEKIIKKVNNQSLVDLETQIDSLSIKLLEKRERIDTIIEATDFLNNIDDTKPNKYKDENKYKILNDFLISTEYDNLGVSNLFAIHNALKENFKIVQKAFKDRKENEKMEELKSIAKKAKRARFTKNINKLKNKIEEIKNSLNNINQIFNLKDFPKMDVKIKKQIKLAQKNSTEFIKKLS